WQQIFSYLSTSLDIKAVSLTCTCFRQLAQPLLFSKISTYPAPPAFALHGFQTNNFFLSPLIAPAVRECLIHSPLAEDDGLPTDLQMDAIFDCLHKLPNLKVLGCQSVRLTSRRLEALHALTLTTVTLESCLSDLTDSTHHPALPLSSVTFKYHDSSSRDAILAPLFSLFLSPCHLQRLSATSPEILSGITLRRPFTRLLQLELPADCLADFESFVAALSHFPNLERITLTTNPDGRPPPRATALSALPTSLLPHLNFYRGPHNYAGVFACTGHMDTLELTLPAKAHRLLHTLSHLPPETHHTLDFLSFRLAGPVPTSLLESPSHLHALLACTAPRPHIRSFRIRVEGRGRDNPWIPPMEEAADAVDCFKRIRAEVERVYPGLGSLKLLYGVEGGAVVWRRDGATGKLVQAAILQ
ncbi:hypothetical protein B0H14DRAFT_2700963, partial [Mycena olivaceomarginata]